MPPLRSPSLNVRVFLVPILGLMLATACQAQEWTQFAPSGGPGDRLSGAWVYDSSRDKFLLFGGANGPSTQYSDTWEWDRATQVWTLVANTGPTARSVMASAYDPVRSRSVVWGGAVFAPSSLGTFFNETWEWDGSSWQAGPTAPFAGRCGARMAFDSSSGRLVLFGGQGQSSFVNDLWEYDGVSWVQLHAGGSGAPPARFFHEMVYDASRGVMVVFGGSDGVSDMGDTWEWDGVQWTQQVGVAPPARSEHAMQYVPHIEAAILYGGAAAGSALGDCWMLKAGRWFKFDCRNAPTARRHPIMQYSAIGKACVMFGGQGALPLNELWELSLPNLFDVNAFPVSVSGPKPAVARHALAPLPNGGALLFGGETAAGPFYPTFELKGDVWSKQSSLINPLTRTRSALVLDASRGENLLFGGLSPVGNVMGDTWTYSAGQWALESPAASPSPRAGHAVAYDATAGICWLFGGEDSAGQALDDMWTWDGSQWSQYVPVHVPPARWGHQMHWDERRGYMVLHGGFGSSGPSEDTWFFDGDDWSQHSIGPGGREGSALAWDPIQSRMLQFGNTRDRLNGDFWSLSLPPGGGSEFEWKPLLTSPIPSARVQSSAVFDLQSGSMLLFGGLWQGVALGETWRYDGQFWSQLSPATEPPAMFAADMVYDASRGVSVMFGGFSQSGAESNTWEWAGNTWVLRATATTPSARGTHAMAYDAARQRVVMYGGRVAGGSLSGQTWEYDGLDWTLMTTSGPSARHRMSMAYDVMRAETVMYGGRDDSGQTPETWVWNGSVWTQRFPQDRPEGVVTPVLEYDPSRGRVIAFGGRDDAGSVNSAESWEWDGFTWTEMDLAPAALAVNPGPVSEFAMAYDPRSEQVIVMGGASPSGCSDGIWAWEGGRWTPHGARPGGAMPQALAGAAAYVDAVTSELRFVGGECGGQFRDDVWSLQFPVAARSSQFGLGCPGAFGVPTLSVDSATAAVIGENVRLVYRNAASMFLPVFIALGSSNESFQGIPLPVDLAVAGLPGCSLLISAERIELAGLPNSNLEADYVFPVPNLSILIGLDFYFQGLHLEPITSPNFAAMSRGVSVRVGDR